MLSVGIDIGSYAVKISAVEFTKKGLFLTHFFEKVFVNPNILDRELEIIEYLRTELTIFDPIQTRFTLGLNQELVSVRTKSFPFKDRIKILKSLPFELEEDLPFNSDETLFDGRIIQFDSVQSEILACASPTENIKKSTQFMNDCNIQISLLTPEGLAFSNHFLSWNEPIPVSSTPLIQMDESEDEVSTRPLKLCQVILNIGHSHSTVLLLEDKKLTDVRTISWGAKAIAEALSKKYQIPITEAYKQLQTNSFILTTTEGATPDQIFYSSLISGVVSDLVKDLKFSVLEFQSLHHCQVTAVLISGGMSLMQNLGPYLTQGLEIPVNKYSVLSNYQNIYFEKTPHIDAVIGPSLGLAIEGLRKPRNPAVSLLRGEYSLKSHKLHSFLTKWSTTLKYAAFLFIAFFAYTQLRDTYSITMAEQSLEVMKDQAKTIARLKGSKANENNINKFIKEKKKTIKEIKTISGIATMNSASTILKKINDAIPSRQILPIEMSRVVISETNVLLEGYVAQPKDVTLLQNALKGLSINNKINSSQSRLPTISGRSAFKVEFEVDRNIQRVTK